MTTDWIRQTCMSFPNATEQVQWGNDLVFKIGGKMFAVAPLEPVGNRLSFKCSPEDFGELVERPGIVPAPYLARAHWVALETPDAMPLRECAARLRRAYDRVLASLPKKVRSQLGQ